MKRNHLWAAAAALSLLAGVALAANAPNYNDQYGIAQAARGVVIVNPDGSFATIGAGGGGDASAANQTSQITQETAVNTVLGVKGDAKSTATDTTAISGISIWKQISASVQSIATSISGTLAVTQSGTWTVQPGNTANTTAWKVDGSAVTQPVSGTITANLAAGANAIGKLAANSGVDIGDVDVTSISAGENHLGAVGGHTIVQAASATITRPADTTAYASGDLVANSVTAGSVNALQFTTACRVSGGTGTAVGARIQKSTAGVTNAAFRLDLFDTIPTFTSAGDNSAISTVVQASGKGYLGYIDITAMTGFSDVAWGTGAVDNSRGNLPYKCTAQILYGILEARGAYTPGNAEVFTISLMAFQD